MVSGVAVTVVNSAMLAVAYPLYLHFLGYEQYGIWLVLSTVLSFAQLGNLGIGPAVTKLVAEEYGRKNLEAVQQYITSALAILVVSGAIVVALILLFRTPIVALFKLSPENAHTVLWLLPYMACLSAYVFVVQAVNAALAGLGRMDLSNYIQTGGRIIAVVVAAVMLFLGRGITSLLVGSTLSYVFVHATSSILVRRIAPIHTFRPHNLDLRRMRRLFRFGGGVFGGTVITILFHPINKILLSQYVGVSSLPAYEIGFNGTMQIRAVVEAGLRALLPEISRISAEMTEAAKLRLSGINHRTVTLIFSFGTPFYAVFFIFAEPLLRVWLGGDFPAVLPSFFRVMLIVSFISLLAVPAYYALLGISQVLPCFLGSVITAAVHFLTLGALWFCTGELTLLFVGYGMLCGMSASTLYLVTRLNSCAQRLPINERGVVPDVSALGY